MAPNRPRDLLRAEHQARMKLAERLAGKDPEAQAAQMTDETFPQDPILAHYGQMLEFGALASRYFPLERVEAVSGAWNEAVEAAEEGNLGLTKAELARWRSHAAFASAFYRLIRLCHEDMAGV